MAAAAAATPQPTPETDEIKTLVASGVAEVLLDRPKALNALNTPMVKALRRLYADWDAKAKAAATRGAPSSSSSASAAAIIVLRASPAVRDRAFCAGGDVKGVVQAAREGRVHEALGFFEHEYACDWAIGGPLAEELERAKPAAANAAAPSSSSSSSASAPPLPLRVAFVDGVIMGGGVGLSVHGHAVVATERTVFAMPEVAIGLHPDVGAMARLAAGPSSSSSLTTQPPTPLHGGLLTPRVGLWLALSGARVGGSALRALGLATHCLPSSSLDAAVAALRGRQQQQQQQQSNSLAGDPAALSSILAQFEYTSEAEADDAAERDAAQKAAAAAAAKGKPPPTAPAPAAAAMTARELRARLPLIEAAFAAGDARQRAGDPGGAVAAVLATLHAVSQGRSHTDDDGDRQLLPTALQPGAAAVSSPEARAFAALTAKAIESGSAFSAAVTLEHAYRCSRGIGLRECLELDYSLAARFTEGEKGDFWEGVRAKLVDRGAPGTLAAQWRYRHPRDVPAAEVRAMFEPYEGSERALRDAGIATSGGAGRARL